MNFSIKNCASYGAIELTCTMESVIMYRDFSTNRLGEALTSLNTSYCSRAKAKKERDLSR